MSSTQVTEEFRNISLSVKISKAKLNVSVAKFGQMNPYAVVRFQD